MIAPMPQPRIQFFDDNGDPLAGGFVYTCIPGGTINDLKTSYQDAGKTTPNTNPVELDSAGRATIFLDGFYHIFVQDSDEVDIYNVDNVSSSSFGSSLNSQWITWPDTPTFISGTQFKVDGNHASDFPIGLRVKAEVTAGTIYGTVEAVSAGGAPVETTVTVIWDSGTLDSGLSAVALGIITPVYSSAPVIPVLLKNGAFVYSIGDLNQLIVASSASPMNFTLPSAIPDGSWTRIHNAGAGTVTLVGTVNGIASPTIATQADALLFFDGSNWYGLFYDGATGKFTASLSVGSEDSFPTFYVNNAGDLDVSGGTDDIWGLYHQATGVLSILADHSISLSQPLVLAGAPTTDLMAATKKYVDDAIDVVEASIVTTGALTQFMPVRPENKVRVYDVTAWNDQAGITPIANLAMWEGYFQGDYQAATWRTWGATNGDNGVLERVTNNQSVTEDEYGGFYGMIYLPTGADVYFHLFTVSFYGDSIGDNTISRGLRIGIGTPLTDTTVHSYATNGPKTYHPLWPTVISPSTFSDPWTSSAANNPAIIHRVVLGPVTFAVAGWYAIFIQAYYRSEDHGQFYDPIYTIARIEGGVFASLSAS